jgi:hypothetical protein
MDRQFEIEELDEKIKFLFSLKLDNRTIISHCKRHESCSSTMIRERIKAFKDKQKFKNGKPIR